MTTKPLIAYCADYLKISNADFAKLITKHAIKHCDKLRAERIRDGKEAVPAYAWSALRSVYTEQCPHAQKLISYQVLRGKTTFPVTVADMENPTMSAILARALLQLPPDMKAAYDPLAPSNVETWDLIS